MLNELVPIIQKLTEKRDLTIEESNKAFSILIQKDLESYFFFTFTAALHTKGETTDELFGFIKSTQSLIPKFNLKSIEKIIDISGTGGDLIKTINVGTAVSFILHSYKILVAKQSFSSVTGPLGSADLLQTFGVDPIKLSFNGPEAVKNIFEETGLVYFVTNFLAKPENQLGITNWIKKRNEIGLNFITPFHLAANVYSPFNIKYRIYGMFNDEYLEIFAKLFQKLGYVRGIICNGLDGLDEISNIGDTRIVEFIGSERNIYTLRPEDFGVKKVDKEKIQINNKQDGIENFLRIIYAKEKGPKRDLVAINAGASFYVLGLVKNFKEGTSLAIDLLDSGKVSNSFESYINSLGNSNKLQNLKNILKN